MTPPLDQFSRPLGSLRLSVTDRCNLRCRYCMPEEEYHWLPKEDILHFEELDELAQVFGALGVDHLRLTGGEPLLRHDLPALVRLLSRHAFVRDLALTTNGVLLAEQAVSLAAAGLRRVTVSLDTLRADRFRTLAGREELPRVLAGCRAARAAGLPVKINSVIIRGVNDDELADLLALARELSAEVRFIEYMDVGGATRWSMEQVVSRAEILTRVERTCGPVEPCPGDPRAPAERFSLPDGTTFGIIASTTAPFCGACDRSRLTADGTWYTCLYATEGVDLKTPLRARADRNALIELVASTWRARRDRGAEDRLAQPGRGPFIGTAELRRNIRLEMHTRGG